MSQMYEHQQETKKWQHGFFPNHQSLSNEFQRVMGIEEQVGFKNIPHVFVAFQTHLTNKDKYRLQ